MSEPLVSIISTERIYDPGCHCAFTDLTHWRGRVWLCFREALNHSVHPSSHIVIMASADHGRTFQLMARISSPGLDVRDPKFFVIEEKLHLVVPCWQLSDRTLLTFIARSSDGLDWEQHTIPALKGYVVWRPRKCVEQGKDVLYAAAYGKYSGDERHVKLLRSTNGLEWRDVSVIHDRDQPNETELCFLASGELLALVRREVDPFKPLLARCSPPYTGPWKKIDCDQFFQGPLLERLDRGMLAIGRALEKPDQKEKNPRVTKMFSLNPETGALAPFATLESGADNSYAGWAQLPAGAAAPWNVLISYYSGHGYDNGAWQGGETPQRAAIFIVRARI
ncbi:MAG TPA: hypothetical protein VEJ63_01005 [Planctomycetota bacterium]|nr:hypothetical protein [Planctomycetota bacterium]